MPGKSPVNVVLGAGGYGRGLSGGSKTIDDKDAIQSIFDEFKRRGYNQIDTARIYGSGTSEEILAELDYDNQGLVLDTKIKAFVPLSLNPENIKASVQESLKALQNKKIRILYFHAPDRETPLEVTLAAVNEEFKKGNFEKLGLSNYSAEEVEKAVQISKEKGYVVPSVYQGGYNLLARSGEKDLFPVLRKHGISFFAYSPIAGSFLGGDVSKNFEAPPNTRFDPNTQVGVIFRQMYFKDTLFEAIEKLKQEAAKHGTTLPDIALRWIVHHSQLSSKYDDAIITGASRLSTLQKTLDAVEQPPLPADILKIVEDLWENIKADAPPYHF